MKELILVDVDETTSRTIEDGVFPFVNSEFWTNFTHETTIDYRDVFQNWIIENWVTVSVERKIEIFNSTVLQDRWKNLIRTVEWSVEKILELSEWHEIGMLTARHPIKTDYTREWARHMYNWKISKIIHSGCYHGWKKTKPYICKEEWAIMMIEDDIDYAIAIAKEWILTYLLRRPWNEQRKETHKNIKKIDDWSEVKI